MPRLPARMSHRRLWLAVAQRGLMRAGSRGIEGRFGSCRPGSEHARQFSAIQPGNKTVIPIHLQCELASWIDRVGDFERAPHVKSSVAILHIRQRCLHIAELRTVVRIAEAARTA